MAEPGLFISYRREDVPGHAGRLYDRLAQRFGDAHVFMDVDSIALGHDFVAVLEQAVASCQVMLVMIGPRWRADLERLTNPQDYVRIEVQAALDRGIPVVPVLVQGARLPAADELPEPLQPLVRRQAVGLGDTSFTSDARLLIERLERVVGAATRASEPDQPWRAICQKIGRPTRRLEVTLSHSTHVIEYENPALRPNEVRLDGQVVGKTSAWSSGEDTSKERYEFSVPDGRHARPALLDVELGAFTIKELTLSIDGVSLYKGP